MHALSIYYVQIHSASEFYSGFLETQRKPLRKVPGRLAPLHDSRAPLAALSKQLFGGAERGAFSKGEGALLGKGGRAEGIMSGFSLICLAFGEPR